MDYRENSSQRFFIVVKRMIKLSLPIFGLLVVIGVFWWLKLTGITMAGDAFCGYDEHTHDESCYRAYLVCQEEHEHTDRCYENMLSCQVPEHIHTVECYSDITADLESKDIWEATLPTDTEDMTTDLKVVATAESQLGYEESSINYMVDELLVKHGYTRYGEWYGNPYGEWANLFTSFCLAYGGADDITPHINADAIMEELAANDRFKNCGDYAPVRGDILFLDKDNDKKVDTTAIITEVTSDSYKVIEGDLDNKVATNTYTFTDKAIEGFGMTDPGNNLLVVDSQNATEETEEAVSVETEEVETEEAVTEEAETEEAVTEEAVTEEVETEETETEEAVTEEIETEEPESEETTQAPVMSMNASALANATATAELTYIAKTTSYDQSLFTENNNFVVYTQNGSNYYAFDGNGNAVQIYIDDNGVITADVSDPNILLWSFTYSSTDNYLIQNLSTGRYMHAYANNGGGVTTSGAYSSTLVSASGGVRVRSNSEYARLDTSQGKFVLTQYASQAAIYNFGITSSCTVWIDGTDGGIMALSGSQNKSYTVELGDTIMLPTQWQAPPKYDYELRGWYDVKNSRYYAPGSEVTVNENLVFYADWVAKSYDVGQFNSYVSDTVSTNDFVTTKVFDYTVLFNMMSQNVTVDANASGHSESWSMVHSGSVPYKDMQTLDFVFIDYDATGDVSYASGRDDRNISNSVYTGLYNDTLGNLLFGTDNSFDPLTGEGVIGKEYLGTADHLFRLMTDPNDENFGYYYYDSRLNAASYNQSQSRFYVYDYLERTADSEKDGGDGGYSDFLPFNSPYANTSGKTVNNYSYAGDKGEYNGVTHYQYDAKYNTNNNSTDNVGTNYAFGMSLDIEFYLPNTPGDTSNGSYGNLDVNGNEMHFKFSGDDDVWVLLDGELVLDIGGVHGIESGDINFSNGAITVNGTQVGTLEGVTEGRHILTVHYLERGSSQSNCAIYFNLAPRFSFSIRKEDVLTQEVLNGTQFSVFDDRACTQPSELWATKASHDAGDPSTNVFTVTDGVANMWGMSAGRTYYIKETKGPDDERYGIPNGIIAVSLDKRGVASYAVEMIEDENGNPPSDGFTVHGFRIDEETQRAYMVVTNAKTTVTETTELLVTKKWDDTEDHSAESITAYLTVTDADGTVRKIREATLNESNDWTYVWTGLPKYEEDGVTEIVYGVDEAYIEGYSPTIEKLDSLTETTLEWQNVTAFENGKTYLLSTSSGCLSTTSATANTFSWVDSETAKSSSLARWVATVSGSSVKLTNEAGQTLTFNYSYYSSYRYFYPTTSSESYQNLVSTYTGSYNRFYVTAANRSYYIGSLNSNGRFSATTSSSSAVNFTLMTEVETTVEYDVNGYAYRITNTPLDVETQLKVYKVWDTGMATDVVYEQEQVTVKLLANGVDTGRTVTLSLKNNWQDVFLGLPYTDADGNIIVYSVVESWETEDWLPSYSSITNIPTTVPTYEITVTNTYRWGHGYILPETGGNGHIIWILSGGVLMLSALIYGCAVKYKKRRGVK